METLDCGHEPDAKAVAKLKRDGFGGVGYGEAADGKRHCYACCAKHEREAMRETGKAILYLVRDNGAYSVQDWAGHLRFRISSMTRGRHNIAGSRRDVWFRVPDDMNYWHGVQYGENTQAVRCRRTKQNAV